MIGTTLALAFAMTTLHDANGQTPGRDTLPPAADAAAGGEFRAGTMQTPTGEIDYKLYLPAELPAAGARALVVMVHGCTQDADDLSRGTRMNGQADAEHFVVLWPQQRAANHPQKCWNWYDPAHARRGAGEVARLHALIEQTVKQEGIDPTRVFMVGLSAGGAMAMNYAVAYPATLRAFAVASSPPALVANDVPTALAVMKAGPAESAETTARVAFDAMGPSGRAAPLLVIHGASDAVVSIRNLDAIASQWRGLAALLGVPAEVSTRRIEGLGHAWSGGDPSGSFTNPATESATAMVMDWFHRFGLGAGR